MTQPALSVAEFAERVLKTPLWPHQVELAESRAFITTCAAARRTGKSTVAQVLAMWSAFSHRDAKVIIVSAGQDSSRRMTEAIAAELNAHALTRGAVVDDYATRIRLTNGSEIISLPASQKQIRGYGKNVRLLVMDEAGFQPGELWQAAHYTALDERANGSRIVLLGSPWGPVAHFFRRSYEAGLSGDPDYKTLHWTAKVNPLLDHAYLERQRDRVSAAEFAAEIEGKWSDAVGSLFSRELLDKQTADIVIPPLRSLRMPATGIIGCDWATSFDRCAAAAIFRLPVQALNPDAPRLPRFVLFPYTWPQGAELHRVVDDIAASLAPFAYVGTEVNGIGAMPSSELRRRSVQTRGARRDRTHRTWEFISTTAATKTTAYGLLLGLLERGALVLPRDPDLLRQLAGLRFEQRERGFTAIGAENAAVHDDICDAAMLATIPRRPPGAKRVVCHLAALAASSRAPADARVPELDTPVVQTGGGLRVPQVPTLQSVNSQAWTAYAPVRAPRPEGITRGRYFIRTTKTGVSNA